MSVVERVLSRWDALDDTARRQTTALLLCGIVFLVHYVFYTSWFIEDAAISFAYARNLAAGDGFVTYVGGEPVQGFSNPTWTLLLAALEVVGIDPWVGSKLMGALFGLVGLPFALLWTRSVLGPRADLAAALAPLLLAVSPQYVNWAASGLENSLVTLCMAIGGALLLREVAERRAVPWSGVWWSLLAISRPEAPVFAVLAGVVGGFSIWAQRGFVPALDWASRWLLLAVGPFLAWHGFAYAHFAFEAPNTYYAKLHDTGRFVPWTWSGRGARSWNYVRTWALVSGQGFMLWLYALGLVGWRAWRAPLAIAVSVLLYVVLLPGVVWLHELIGEAPLAGTVSALGPEGALPLWPFAPDPQWWVTARVLLLAGLAVVLPLVGVGRRGQSGRVLATWLVAFGLFFAIYAGGDWMKGHRWMGLVSVPLAVLLADALTQLWDQVAHRPWNPWLRLLVPGVPLLTVLLLSVVQDVILVSQPETGPYTVARRVAYMHSWGDRLGIERPTFMDVDMGAHMWFAGDTSPIVDMAGLVDMPMGHHKWERSFVSEYVYKERQPDFAHVHGSWASRTRMRNHAGWRAYVPVDDLPVSPHKTHVGNHVHRRHFFVDAWPWGDERQVEFQGGLDLAGWRLPAPVVMPGGTVTVQVGWRHGAGVDGRGLLVLSGPGGLVVRELPPAYDQVPQRSWSRREIARGEHRFELPADLAEGTYDLAIVVIGANARVQPPETLPDGATTDDPVFARGEVRWAGVLQVASPARVLEVAESGLDQVLAHGDCDTRQARWRDVRHHLPPEHPWHDHADDTAASALAACFARRGLATLDAGGEVAAVLSDGLAARHWDPRSAEAAALGDAAGPAWRALSVQAEADGDLDAAYALARDAMALDPYDAWARRRTERLRDLRLKIEATPSLLDRVMGW